MNFMKELEEGIRNNSFEDNDRSLEGFLYMDGNLQSEKNDKMLVYRWNSQKGCNEPVWKDNNDMSW